MTYTIEGKDIVFRGLEEGISSNPYKGWNDVRGMNIVSIPGEAAVSFAQTSQQNRLVGTIASVDTGTEVITGTLSVGAVTNFIAVQFTTSGTLPAGISLATTYWVNFQSSSTFKIYTSPYLNGSAVNITDAGSGTHTFTSIDIGEVRYFDKVFGYCIDRNGRVWSPAIDASSGSDEIRYTFMNNTITNGSGNGICVYRGTGTTKYLFVFRNGQIDYVPITDTLGIFSSVGTRETGLDPVWVTGWDPTTGSTTAGAVLNTSVSINNPHEALVGQDNAMYYTDASYIGSLRERAGSTFDPTSTSTYTWTQKALSLPLIDIAQCLEENGINLLTGGLYNYIYPWDRSSKSFRYPIFISEKGTARLLTVNTNTYIFAGRRGRIFVTNGSQAELYKKVPDHILGIDPIFTWGGVGYNKGQMYFGISATTNAAVTSTSYAGLWAIDLETKALRVPTLQSTSTATVTAMFSLPSTTAGFGLVVAWKTASTYGIDVSAATPYTTYVAYADTELVPIGQYYNKKTPSNIEWKLATPLVSGEGVKVSYRTNLTEAFTLINETTTAGMISDAYDPNFENVQWVQLRIQTKSTSSTPSFTRLTELRIKF